MIKWLEAALLAGVLTLMPGTAHAASFPRLFETHAYQNDNLDALPQWRRVMAEVEHEQDAYRDCADTGKPCEQTALLAWQSMIKSQAGGAPVDQLRAVNRFVNQWQPRSDLDNYDQQDYWASPLTFLRHAGDCEDYAIIKYVSLRQMGFDSSRLRVVIVQDVLRDLPHAVLAVHVDSEVFILDNLFQAVLPQRMVRQYLPHYSVNERARWAHLPSEAVLLATSPWSIMPGTVTPAGAIGGR